MFQPLSRSNVEEIVKLQFKGVQELLKEQGFSIEATSEAIDWLAQLGYDPQFGARPVKRLFQRKVLNELSKQILSGTIHQDRPILLDMIDNQLLFRNKETELV
jgi:ATP-dependent Clp protease ATP-binding subunit ClpB